MKAFIYSFTLLLSLLLWSCTQQTPMSIHWEMGQNDVKPGVCEMYYTITNHSNQPLTNEGWALYFNYMSLHPIYTEGDQIMETELQASYHSITPTADGIHYLTANDDYSRILMRSFKDKNYEEVVLDLATVRGNNGIKSFDDYILSPKEDRILIKTNSTKIFRRSSTADYYIFTIKNKVQCINTRLKISKHCINFSFFVKDGSNRLSI